MEIYRGKGTNVPYEEYMQVINEAFGFTGGHEREFTGLLPKLYRVGRRPQDENYVVTEDGRCVAAVGAYSHEIEVCGIRIPCRGIGNVAVLREARSRGYMKDCMNMALADMVKDGIAVSTLGGRRQRYRYFSYDRAGICYSFALDAANIRHTYGADYQPGLEIVKVEAGDTELIDRIRLLSERGPFVPVRKKEDFYDIAVSWLASVYACLKDGRFAGYCICEQGAFIPEIKVEDSADFMDFLIALRQYLNVDTIRLRLPEHQTDELKALYPVAEGYEIGCSMSYTVLNYRLVCDAFLKLKAAYTALPDGQLTLLIHGFAGDETIRLSVTDGVPSVTDAAGETPALELSHVQALDLLFAPVTPNRWQLPPFAQAWLPIPIWMYRADEV